MLRSHSDLSGRLGVARFCRDNHREEGEIMHHNEDWYRKKFDAVIIGAGIGGLCAGAILAKKGHKILMVEKCDQVGGRGRCMPYKDYVIANAFRSQAVEAVNQAKEMSGAVFNLKVLPKPVLRFYNVETQTIFAMPEGETDEEKLKENIRWLGDLGMTDPKDLELFFSILHTMATLDAETLDRLDRAHTSFKEYIQTQTSNYKIQRALFDLSTYCSHSIFDWEKLAVADYCRKILSIMISGEHDIFNGDPTDQAIVDAFADVILQNGGEIKLLTEAKKIIVEDGKTRGLLIVDNHFDTWHMAETNHVISNLPTWQNLSILNNDLVPKSWKDNLEQYAKFQGMGVGIWYGLKKKVCDIGSFIRLVSSNEEIGTKGRYRGGALFLSNISPGHTARGKQLLYIEKFFAEQPANEWDVIDETVNDFKKWTPELFEALKAKGLGTHSFKDVVDMEKVNIHRPAWGNEQWCIYAKPEIKAPGIEGLYFVGDSVKIDENVFGYNLAAAAGVEAAQMVMNQL
jgi:hypothetical protein